MASRPGDLVRLPSPDLKQAQPLASALTRNDFIRQRGSRFLEMRTGGLEPPRPFGQAILSRWRLPVPARPHTKDLL